MRSTNSEQLSRMLGDETERYFLSLWAEVAAERMMELTAEINGLLLRLTDYTVSKENLEQKESEREVTVKALMASVKQLAKKVWALQ